MVAYFYKNEELVDEQNITGTTSAKRVFEFFDGADFCDEVCLMRPRSGEMVSRFVYNVDKKEILR